VAEQPTADNALVSRVIQCYKNWRNERSIQPIGTVKYKQNAQELGYIIQIPGFIINWDKLSPSKRKKKLMRYLQQLEELGIRVICVPYYYSVLTPEVIEIIDKRLVLEYERDVRLVVLVKCIKHLIGMLKDKLLSMEVGIWGADSEKGRLWSKILMPYVNNMVLGGDSVDDLYKLADEVIREAGLACPVTTNAELCLKNKQFVVMNRKCNPDLVSNAAICVYSGPLDLEYLAYIEKVEENKRPLWILSGWADLPDKVEANIVLSPWETSGILQALFRLSGGSISDINAEKIMVFKELEDVFGKVKVRGFVSVGGAITYDRFRMRYFRKS
jgi:hypothetical protein